MENVKSRARQSFESHRNLWPDRSFVLSVIMGFVFLILAFVVNYFAGSFANKSVSNPVTDIILDNIRVWDVTFIFVKGAIIFWVSVLIFLIIEPKRFPFALKSIALFTLIRSGFIIMTHLAPFPTRLILPTENMIDMFSFGGDLFFSAHTGGPFLVALIFWDHKYFRYICLASSIIFGVVVLLGHLHYSIDVFAAFFITYTIYHMSRYFFKKDFTLITTHVNTEVLS